MSVRDIKPCPCCGGEANVRFYGDPHCTVMSIVCDECGLGTKTVVLDDYLSAVNAWNRRAERTCEVLGEDYDELLDRWETELSCGHMYHGLAQHVNYCPNCGAKVVE